jgi:hypothetical protein
MDPQDPADDSAAPTDDAPAPVSSDPTPDVGNDGAPPKVQPSWEPL